MKFFCAFCLSELPPVVIKDWYEEKTRDVITGYSYQCKVCSARHFKELKRISYMEKMFG